VPYILSPIIKLHSPGMWNEGDAYSKKNIYKIGISGMPSVNYDEHIFRSHSLTHIETSAHTQTGGQYIHDIYQHKLESLFGKVLVVKLSGDNYRSLSHELFHWEIKPEEIEREFEKIDKKLIPKKILITTQTYYLNEQGYHDPRYVLTLSQEAANLLVDKYKIYLYGTSWKSSDFNPGKPERPIHNTLFSSAIIMENLCMDHVPAGIYFMCAFPIPLENASESPVVPVLFSKEEIMEQLI